MQSIVSFFDVLGMVTSVKPLGAGHINDSYKVLTAGEAPDYVLQRINHAIFKDVPALQNNILRVTTHIRKKLADAGVKDVQNHVLQLIYAKDGKLFHRDDEGNYWRMLRFVPDSFSYDDVNAELALQAGRAFGDFQTMLSDLPGEPLVETIPNFHNMESRLATFRQAVKDNKAGRLQKTQYMVDEMEKRAEEMCRPEQLHREGKLPKRINHCDTKVNNVLFDKNGNVLCVVDLDTVMPGYVLSDFGDFMRTGANTGKEDDSNLNNVSLNMPIFEAYTKGYMEKAKSFLLPVEKDNLAFGAKLLTYMQTVRFFADYLDGDLYYKIHSPEHNWIRTLAQFKLLQDMENKYDRMRKVVQEAEK
ncbi:MAG: aminoglycoside phosphotransferase family protein [Bacteroidales bacterium]|jgi:Ser/Thr protein kinase RdoA (MazF antagonist)|nr:aminoglycoside phosphotransferase family protein [Bacteroidales bacterium]